MATVGSSRISLPSLLAVLILAVTPTIQAGSTSQFPTQDSGNLRIIITQITPESSGLIRSGRCETIHVLVDGLAVNCPGTIASYLLHRGIAVEDKIVSLFDLESDVYINADDSWALGFNGTSVKVAVLDTGVDTSHPELSDSILATANFAGGPNKDTVGHGTHVAGIITANGGRQISGTNAQKTYNLADPNQATGAAPGAFILSGKVCKDRGCFDSDIMAGIEWAVRQGARVINLSLGGGNFGTHCDNDLLAAKANWAVGKGVVVVASSGNDAKGVSSPACGSKVIAVGAVYQRNIGRQDYSPTCIDETSPTDQIVCFSNTGPALDLVAPGAGVLSTYSCQAVTPPDCSKVWYAWFWGTSQASPHVAATAALVLSVNKTLTPIEVKNMLESTARDLGPPGRDDTYGWGLVNPLAAIAKAGAPLKDIAVTQVRPEKNVTYNAISAQPLRLNATVQNLGPSPESFNLNLYANATLVASQSVSLQANTSLTVTFRWNTTSMARGAYVLSVTLPALKGELNTSNNQLGGGVQVNFPGDTNGDGFVNFIDLGRVGTAFLSTPDSPNWDGAADFNNDHAVNFIDLGIVGSLFLRVAG